MKSAYQDTDFDFRLSNKLHFNAVDKETTV